FPPVEIGDDWYWDGGIASNAPLQHVLDEGTAHDKNIFQVDLFPAEGPFPDTLLDAETRAQDIRYASRTRLNTNLEMALSPARLVVRRVLDSCTPDLSGLSDADLETLRAFACEQHIEIAQIIYRDKAYGGKARGFEFSRPTMEAHRAAGRRDAARALAVRDWRQRPAVNGVNCIDVGADDLSLKPKPSR
ncbi:MAG: patatin-like phospholipase family protein, partial [Sandaracinobacteroides sp.]